MPTWSASRSPARSPYSWLAADHPDRVQTLTLIEPPPVNVPSAPEFRAASHRLLQTRHEQGVDAALDEFLTLLEGDDWRRTCEQQLPGSVAQMSQDARTFFDVDLPALLAWRFAQDDAARVDRPVAYVGGTDSGPWFAEVRALIRSWFPEAEDAVIEGAGHSLAVTHVGPCARAISAFLGRHPIA